MRRQISAAITVAVLLGLTTGCTNDATRAAPSPSSTPVPATSAPATPKDQAVVHATEALDRYFDVTNQMYNDPSIPTSELKQVAISVGLALAEAEYTKYSQQPEIVHTGDATYEILKVLEVSLDNSNPTRGLMPTVRFQVCWDLSDTKAVDKDGKSVIHKDRLDRSVAEFTLSNYSYTKQPQKGWKVGGYRTPGARTC